MKKILIALLALLSLLSLTGCGPSDTRYSVSVYRVVAPYFRTDGQLLRAEETLVQPGLGVVNSVISSFNALPSDGELASPLVYGARIYGYEQKGSVLYLDANSVYGDMPGLELTLANCCAVLTFCSLPEISKVAVRVGGTIIFSPTAPEEILLSDVTS